MSSLRHSLGRVRGRARTWQRRLRAWWRGESAETFFDIHDLRAVNVVLESVGVAGVARLPPAGVHTDRVEQVFDVRPDLRQAFPFGRTPHPDRALYLRWLVAHGRSDFGLELTEILAALRADDACPDRGLKVTFQLNPTWQAAVPDGIESAAGFDRLKAYLTATYGLCGRWFERAKLTEPVPRVDASRGINLVGHFRYTSGLQEALLGLDHALRSAGVPVTRRDLPLPLPREPRADDFRGLEQFDTTIYLAAVNTFPDYWCDLAGIHWRSGVRRIAVWYWELGEVPDVWAARLTWADEVWAPTEFLAEAYRAVVKVPVKWVLPGVPTPAVTPRTRAELGVPEGFLFLVTFDMGSVMARKNPLGAIAAFHAAFPGGRAGVHLMVKVSRGTSDPDNFAALQAAIASTPNAHLTDAVLPRAEVNALLATADCYVSLHRAEGLGLGMAESMLLGKPVIATNYSGNCDFMPPGTAFLVPYSRVPLLHDEGPYPAGTHWAEPDLEQAAFLMRQVVDAPEVRAEVAAAGLAHAQTVLSIEAYAKRVSAALEVGRTD